MMRERTIFSARCGGFQFAIPVFDTDTLKCLQCDWSACKYRSRSSGPAKLCERARGGRVALQEVVDLPGNLVVVL